MNLQEPILHLLEQLSDILASLSDIEYTSPVPSLSHSTLGQHTRHIIEFFTELSRGYEEGVVDYDSRKRSYLLETNRHSAMRQLEQIGQDLTRPAKEMFLLANFGDGKEEPVRVPTNYHRELVYNLEHTVHHMALLRVGILSLTLLAIPDNFGVAASTLQYRKICVQ